MPYDKKTFSDNLNRYLKLRGENQQDLCRLLGVSSSTASSWCDGSKMPRMEKEERMEQHFSCRISDLLEHQQERRVDDEILQAIHDEPGMRMMFDLSKHRNSADILAAVEIIKAFYKTKDGGDA